MASSAVRALIVAEARDIRSRIVLVLLTSIAWFALAAAGAPTAHAQAARRGELQTEPRGDAAHLRGLSVPACAEYRPAADVPLTCEFEASEPEHAEDDASFHSAVVCLSAAVAPLPSRATQGPTDAPTFWVAQFATSAALPRGPPYLGR